MIMDGHLTDVYVIRIYRRDPDDPRKMNGLVEIISTDRKKPFANPDDLWNILQPAGNTEKKATGKEAKQHEE